MKHQLVITVTAWAMILCALPATAGKKAKEAPKPVIELTDQGKALEASYAAMIKELQAKIKTALPAVDAAKAAAYQKAIEAEKPFEAERKAKEKALNACKKAQGEVERAEKTIAKLPKSILDAKEQLKKAEAAEGDAAAKEKAIQSAKKKVAKLEAQLAKAKADLPKVKEAAEKAKADEPGLAKELEDAKEALTKVQVETMKAMIAKALPAVDEAKIVAFINALEAEKPLEAEKKAREEDLNKSKKITDRVWQTQRTLDNLPDSILAAEEQLKKAEAFEGEGKEKLVSEAKASLAKKQEQLMKAKADMQGIKAAAAEEEAVQAKLVEAIKDCEKALADAKAVTIKALMALGIDELLSSDKLDAMLVANLILTEATPRGLAEFAQESEDNAKLVEALLADSELMLQMAVADGANGGKYGQAMKIYTDIQKASPKSKEGLFQKLALAIALEHAVPKSQRNATGNTDAPKTVDPVKRYLAYEKAYIDGELDPGFEVQSVYNLRMVVDGEEPDEIAAWGREMLRNYRPDHINTDDYRWRYVKAVKTEVRYGSQDCKFDKPDQQFFQNILMNGGICGRRAFFGRFILRAFGVPTTARPQPGHAALAHWTPDGWVVCLGAGWKWGSTRTRYSKDLDFLANTQARESDGDYLKVKRAQWIGDIVGEKPVYGFFGGRPEFWYTASLYVQRGIIDEAKAVALAAVGTDIGEANESKVKDKLETVLFTEEDRKVVVGDKGVITIPAAACSSPTNDTDKIKFMKSNLGGMQLHYGRIGKDEPFEYSFDAPKAGKYKLTARVVTPSWKQHLFLKVNDVQEQIDIALPYTVGMWDTTAPVVVDLSQGKNILRFTRAHEGLKGVTIRDFTLTPVN